MYDCLLLTNHMSQKADHYVISTPYNSSTCISYDESNKKSSSLK